MSNPSWFDAFSGHRIEGAIPITALMQDDEGNYMSKEIGRVYTRNVLALMETMTRIQKEAMKS